MTADVLVGLAADQLGIGPSAEAEALLAAALALEPENPKALWTLGCERLAQGRYAEGFRMIEARHAFPHLNAPKPPLPFPEWRGEPVGRLLVWPEQGYGDQIQMARFARVLAARGIEVTWVAPTPLVRLFGALPAQIVEWTPKMVFDAPDAWAMAFGLPLRLGTAAPEDVPATPYLRAPDAARERWKGMRGIGIAWRGNPAQLSNARRSLPSPELLAPLAAFGELVDLVEPRGDFADTAAIIERLDLVVTVCTSTAHLAGAMGKPCIVMLAHKADWRWLRGRADSPWYPCVRIVRQPRPGDWKAVAAEVVATARTMLGA